MRIVAGRTNAACRVMSIKSGVHLLGEKGYVRFSHKADITKHSTDARFGGKAHISRTFPNVRF
jgi:hypothetical protein